MSQYLQDFKLIFCRLATNRRRVCDYAEERDRMEGRGGEAATKILWGARSLNAALDNIIRCRLQTRRRRCS